jgi:hypothetical protein
VRTQASRHLDTHTDESRNFGSEKALTNFSGGDVVVVVVQPQTLISALQLSKCMEKAMQKYIVLVKLSSGKGGEF